MVAVGARRRMPRYGDSFAAYYRLSQGGWARELAPRLRSYLTSLNLPDESLLDVCCGTGEVLEFFSRDGWRVIGVDNSPGMLAEAEDQLAGVPHPDRVGLVLADATQFSVDQPAGVCLLLNGSINHLMTSEDVGECFAQVRDALLPGGYVIFDAFTLEHYDTWNSVTIIDEDDAVFVNRGFWIAHESRGVYTLSGAAKTSSGWLRVRQQLEQRYHDPATLEHLLALAGFTIEQCQLEPPDSARTFYQGRFG